MKFELPRGLRDLPPEEFELFEAVRHGFVSVAQRFGFRLMEPSPIENLATLEARSGPAIRNEIYHFADKSGRSLGLRFDLTVGLTRYVAGQRGLPLPIKLGAFAGMWRYDEPQHGRYRWFYQWDAEIFGERSIEADAEVIEFTAALFREIGLPEITIEVGDRKTVEEFVRRRLGIDNEDRLLDILRAVDKLGKKPRAEILREYAQKGVTAEVLEELTRFGTLQGSPQEVISRVRGEGLDAAAQLGALADSLATRGVSKVRFNMGIVRGLDYYNGIVFEVFDEAAPKVGALAGGGRYDALTGALGRPELGATGVAGGVDRTVLALGARKFARSEREIRTVYVAFAEGSLRPVAVATAAELRRAGVAAEAEMGERPLKRQLEAASSKRADVAVILAPKEYAAGEAIVRDLATGIERRVPRENLLDVLRIDS